MSIVAVIAIKRRRFHRARASSAQASPAVRSRVYVAEFPPPPATYTASATSGMLLIQPEDLHVYRDQSVGHGSMGVAYKALLNGTQLVCAKVCMCVSCPCSGEAGS